MREKARAACAAVFLLAAGWILFFPCRKENDASAYEKINDPNVFIKQEEPSSCTLCAAAMMLRRAAILSEDFRWRQIGERSLKREAWIEGQGLRHSFSFQSGRKTYLVGHETLPGGEENAELLRSLLKKHPEGIVLYYGPGENQHAVLLTDETDGVFYCADPYEGKPKGRIPLTEAAYVTEKNAGAFWYIVWQ